MGKGEKRETEREGGGGLVALGIGVEEDETAGRKLAEW
jgi:hypothetical protein